MPDPSIATDLRARDVGMTSLVKDADIPWVTFVEAADTCHTLVVPEETTEPTVVLFVVEDALEFLDEDGEPMFVQDAESIHQMYRDALEEAGLPYPHAILQE